MAKPAILEAAWWRQSTPQLTRFQGRLSRARQNSRIIAMLERSDDLLLHDQP